MPLLHFLSDILQLTRRVLIISRSTLVGKPLALLLINNDMTVSIAHSHTPKDMLHQMMYEADIIVSATGVPKLIQAGYLRTGQVVIDVGLTKVDGKLCGDVDKDQYPLLDRMGVHYTPVPGGVGKFTVLALAENVIDKLESFHGEI